MASHTPWHKLIRGKEYTVVDATQGAVVGTGVFRGVVKRWKDRGVSLRFDGIRDTVYVSTDPDYPSLEYHFQPGFAKKLALVNTKANLPPEMLGEIMKFKQPDFKGKSTKALLEAARKNPAVIEHERQKEEQRKADEATRVQKEEDEEEARSRDIVAAMKAGRSSRRRRQSSTSRRSRRSSLSKSRTTRRLYAR